ncbi:MAG: hypothetical protein GWN87_18095, partial [Desulfuromonadales bacterium]|nr:hypothetical protein [Desulfuromonadales bacterium]NIS42009.1 hypothetical protein [Desulfuromonadales bacterium]
MLAFLGERAWRQWPIVGRAWLWSLVVALFFGAAMEAAQMALTSVRVAEWGDWIADGVGAGLALALNGFWHKKSRQE